jgi:hypothetical protein
MLKPSYGLLLVVADEADELRHPPWELVQSPRSQKKCLEQDPCQAEPIKVRIWIFTLKNQTIYSSCAFAPACQCRCCKEKNTKQSPLRQKNSDCHY